METLYTNFKKGLASKQLRLLVCCWMDIRKCKSYLQEEGRKQRKTYKKKQKNKGTKQSKKCIVSVLAHNDRAMDSKKMPHLILWNNSKLLEKGGGEGWRTQDLFLLPFLAGSLMRGGGGGEVEGFDDGGGVGNDSTNKILVYVTCLFCFIYLFLTVPPYRFGCGKHQMCFCCWLWPVWDMPIRTAEVCVMQNMSMVTGPLVIALFLSFVSIPGKNH